MLRLLSWGNVLFLFIKKNLLGLFYFCRGDTPTHPHISCFSQLSQTRDKPPLQGAAQVLHKYVEYFHVRGGSQAVLAPASPICCSCCRAGNDGTLLPSFPGPGALGAAQPSQEPSCSICALLFLPTEPKQSPAVLQNALGQRHRQLVVQETRIQPLQEVWAFNFQVRKMGVGKGVWCGE